MEPSTPGSMKEIVMQRYEYPDCDIVEPTPERGLLVAAPAIGTPLVFVGHATSTRVITSTVRDIFEDATGELFVTTANSVYRIWILGDKHLQLPPENVTVRTSLRLLASSHLEGNTRHDRDAEGTMLGAAVMARIHRD